MLGRDVLAFGSDAADVPVFAILVAIVLNASIDAHLGYRTARWKFYVRLLTETGTAI